MPKQLKELLELKDKEIDLIKNENIFLRNQNNELLYKLKLNEKNSANHSKLYKMIKTIKYILKIDSKDLSSYVNSCCKIILEHCIFKYGNILKKYNLALTKLIFNNDIVYYKVKVEKNNWSGIETVFSYNSNSSTKVALAFEILSLNENIIRSIVLQDYDIENNQITKIEFIPISDSINKEYYIRFMGMKELESNGVMLYEWQKLDFLGRKKSALFFGKFLFE